MQGGHSSRWQLIGHLCPHGRSLIQGNLHSGGIVPQGKGGCKTVFPQRQVMG